jgi:exosortase A
MKRDLDFPVAMKARTRRDALVAVAFAAVAIVALYWSTAQSIVAIWIRSETFAHGFVVIPAAIWLAWRRRAELAVTPVRPWWPGIGLVFVAGAAWLVASAAGAGVVMQFALVAMVQAAIVTIIGLRAARVVAFALAFLLFAPPAGEFLVPTLMDWTADFTVAALRFSGVPVYREGNHFVIPTGYWSVIEACSGVRYLIASLMVGTIYAAVAYRSAKLRAAFLVASVAIPLVANWLRAYMIVMLGHLSNNRLATGIDHVLYGWVFFGVVMFLLFWAGSRWQEADPPIAQGAGTAILPESGSPAAHRSMAAALAAIVAAGVWIPVNAAWVGRVASAPPVMRAIAGEGGWAAAAGPTSPWKPHYTGYAAERSATYAKDGRAVDLYVAYYRQQSKARELITSGNVFVSPLDDVWRQTRADSATVDWDGGATRANTAEIVGRDNRVEVVQLFWIAGRVTSSAYVAKAYQALARLTGQGDDAALIVAYAKSSANDTTTRERLRAFMNDMSPAIARALAATRDAGR